MNEVRSFDKSVSIPELKAMQSHRVYGWSRNGEYLYIGCTVKGFARLFKHGVLGVVEPFLDSDTIDFWFCSTVDEAFKLEELLIRFHKPKYNKVFIRKWVNNSKLQNHFKSKSHCNTCLKEFKPTTLNQFICWECRVVKTHKVNIKLATSKPIEKLKIKLPSQ